MPKVVTAEELDTVLAAVSQYPDGIGVEQLHSAIAVMPRRTLQRRLAELVAAKRLVAQGQGRGRKYRLPARPATHSETAFNGPTRASRH